MEGPRTNAERPVRNREHLIANVAGVQHDEWREAYKALSSEPRMKRTEDAAWIEAHKTNEVDISATSYAELPKDWQEENRASAEVVVDLVLSAQESTHTIDDAFIEEASAVVHEKWLERNGGHASEDQKLLYAELPEAEKEKDRAIVRAAIAALEHGN